MPIKLGELKAERASTGRRVGCLAVVVLGAVLASLTVLVHRRYELLTGKSISVRPRTGTRRFPLGFEITRWSRRGLPSSYIASLRVESQVSYVMLAPRSQANPSPAAGNPPGGSGR